MRRLITRLIAIIPAIIVIALFGEEKVDSLLIFSQVIWKAVKGEHSEMPAPRRSAFVRVAVEKEEDD